jgi:hypothetical protein
MKLFIKAKHWQLFLVFMGLMFGSQILMINSMEPGMPPNITMFLIPMVLFFAIYAAWLWSISTYCLKNMPEELATSPLIMKAGLVYAGLYFIFGFTFLSRGNTGPVGILVVMHILAMVAMFYSLLFTSRQLVKLERKAHVRFYDYSGPFFMLWFFPIGVWFIQPKVNELLGESV